MIKSMTGYGQAVTELPEAKISVEIKSLNSKFLELNIKLPKAFSDKELMLRNEFVRLMERGKTNVTITVDDLVQRENTLPELNKELAKKIYHQLKELATELEDTRSNLLDLVLQVPDVIKYPEPEGNDEEWDAVYDTLQAAMANFDQFRQDEGQVLEKDLALRIDNIVRLLHRIEAEEPKRIPVVRQRLSQYLAELRNGEYDQNRLEQELIYYIEKFDITEEKIRLKSHCDYFLSAMKEKESNGKKLAFITQEIGREINTLGAKANDAGIQKLVVCMKEELEKVKEQLLNIL